jgi:hypothetical protein
VSNGGSVTVNNSELMIGDATTGNDVLTLSGIDSNLNLIGEVKIGGNGTGVLGVQGGASFSVAKVTVADLGGSSGTLTVDGCTDDGRDLRHPSERRQTYSLEMSDLEKDSQPTADDLS